ncbi:hypothetical protein ACQP2P_30685 [Dactylosporangium sp. CA-139114]|uniref:hypothetical protein n=1 Tax=Dactylosporangium sp. CA-139114 TaxID=3239931 RepID=UPI003D992F46
MTESGGEAARLAALYATAVLDTPPETDFADIAAHASDICGTPIGMVSLVDGDRRWTKAGVGWDGSPQTLRPVVLGPRRRARGARPPSFSA